jgi:hypothetical protein
VPAAPTVTFCVNVAPMSVSAAPCTPAGKRTDGYE